MRRPRLPRPLLRLAALAVAVAALLWAGLLAAGLAFGAAWPDTATAWETFAVLALLVTLSVVASVLTLARPLALSALAVILTAFFTTMLALWVFFAGGRLFPDELRLGMGWRLRVLAAWIAVATVALIVELLRTADPALPPKRVIAKRLLLWGLGAAVVVGSTWYAGERWG